MLFSYFSMRRSRWIIILASLTLKKCFMLWTSNKIMNRCLHCFLSFVFCNLHLLFVCSSSLSWRMMIPNVFILSVGLNYLILSDMWNSGLWSFSLLEGDSWLPIFLAGNKWMILENYALINLVLSLNLANLYLQLNLPQSC